MWHVRTVERNVSFRNDVFSYFDKLNGYMILDFGKELCGGARLVVRGAGVNSRFCFTFGEIIIVCVDRLYESYRILRE